jgi:putative protease
MAEKMLGKVTHYYDKIGVAIIALKGKLKVGDKIKIKKGEEEVEQTIESMQIEHKAVDAAKSGDIIGVKVDKPAKEGAQIYLAK